MIVELGLGCGTAHVDVEVELVHEAFVGLGNGTTLAEECESIDNG